MQITKQTIAGVEVFNVRGQLDATTAPQLETELLAGVQSGSNKLVVDLEHVGLISSAAMRVLLSMAKRMRRQQGKILLCAPSVEVKEVFKISDLSSLFDIYETQAEALATTAVEGESPTPPVMAAPLSAPVPPPVLAPPPQPVAAVTPAPVASPAAAPIPPRAPEPTSPPSIPVVTPVPDNVKPTPSAQLPISPVPTPPVVITEAPPRLDPPTKNEPTGALPISARPALPPVGLPVTPPPHAPLPPPSLEVSPSPGLKLSSPVISPLPSPPPAVPPVPPPSAKPTPVEGLAISPLPHPAVVTPVSVPVMPPPPPFKPLAAPVAPPMAGPVNPPPGPPARPLAPPAPTVPAPTARKSKVLLLTGVLAILGLLILGGATLLFRALRGTKPQSQVALVTPSPEPTTSATPALATPTPTPVAATPRPSPTVPAPTPRAPTPAATVAAETSPSMGEEATNIVTPPRVNLDPTQRENQEVRASVLKRIELMPVAPRVKDQLYAAVDRARRMGKVITITFGSGRTELSPTDVEKLRQAIQQPAFQELANDPSLIFVILGYADARGNEQTNRQISERRAQKTLDALRTSCGLLNVMHTIGMGGSDIFDKQVAERNRAVEVWAVLP